MLAKRPVLLPIMAKALVWLDSSVLLGQMLYITNLSAIRNSMNNVLR